jgi:hypothetical protein
MPFIGTFLNALWGGKRRKQVVLNGRRALT